ncbi:MAG TPA: hypothetical protein PLK35_02290 [Candidatus Moranbacteria bacterium]|nr:hypothetical protein [Candidatus Moranbacteria bacterium]
MTTALVLLVLAATLYFYLSGRRKEKNIADFSSNRINSLVPVNGGYAIECAKKMANGEPIMVPPFYGQYTAGGSS